MACKYDRELEQQPLIIDTRAHPRYATTMMVRAEDKNAMFETRGNISLGGFYFESRLPMHLGMQIEILFRLPGAGLWMKGYGEVIGGQNTETGWAVRGVFKEFDPADLKALNTWMQFIAFSDDRNSPKLPFSTQYPAETTIFTTEFSS